MTERTFWVSIGAFFCGLGGVMYVYSGGSILWASCIVANVLCWFVWIHREEK